MDFLVHFFRFFGIVPEGVLESLRFKIVQAGFVFFDVKETSRADSSALSKNSVFRGVLSTWGEGFRV